MGVNPITHYIAFERYGRPKGGVLGNQKFNFLQNWPNLVVGKQPSHVPIVVGTVARNKSQHDSSTVARNVFFIVEYRLNFCRTPPNRQIQLPRAFNK